MRNNYREITDIIEEYLKERFDKHYGHFEEKISKKDYEQFKKEYANKEKEHYIEPLTGAYTTRIIDILKKYEGNNSYGLCFFIDLNNLKEVNDSYGHQGGDIYLKMVAHLLKEYLLEGDIILRIGGDEFLIMSTRSNGETYDTVNYYNKALKEINKILLEESRNEGFVSSPIYQISFGWSKIDKNKPPAQAIKEALNKADKKMYAHKKSFKNLVIKGNSWQEYVIQQ